MIKMEPTGLEIGDRPVDLRGDDARLRDLRATIVDHLKARHAELRSYLLKIEQELRELGETWKAPRY